MLTRNNATGRASTLAMTLTLLTGYSTNLYGDYAITDLGTFGGTYSYAYGINDSGQVVGYAYTSNNSAQPAFLYSNGRMTDLNSLLPAGSGWTLTSARAINNAGDIVGYGVNPAGQTHAFLLTPDSPTVTPEPSSIIVFSTGLFGLALARRRRASARKTSLGDHASALWR